MTIDFQSRLLPPCPLCLPVARDHTQSSSESTGDTSGESGIFVTPEEKQELLVRTEDIGSAEVFHRGHDGDSLFFRTNESH